MVAVRQSNLCLIVDCHSGISQPFEEDIQESPPARSATSRSLQLAGCEDFKLLFCCIRLLIYQYRGAHRERHIEGAMRLLVEPYFQ